ncbi:MAG: cyclopropane fatty acyl phospholipid synthase [Desulfobacterales bacterium]|jgi:cyclopropane-fatty-acyl-phospholipid synthase|nr:cyclopropane fatty acyl phospholipid synthase [Desulfobacterales bacterium]
MIQPRQLVEDLLAQAGVAIGGTHAWDISVRDERLFVRMLRQRNLGLGEAYMDGWWECPRLDQFFHRVLSSGIEEKVGGSFIHRLRCLPAVLINHQSLRRCRIIADRHYNLDNDLFLAFLDPYNQYSCAYFKETDDLEQAQRNKLELICRKIGLEKTDRLLDIGCGWGGFARYAAEHYGCKVTAANVSTEQLRCAREFCKNLAVEFVDCDYRQIRGRFDKIVSVGMFEHVGVQNYRRFMRVVHNCLSDKGIFLLHTICANTPRRTCDPWITKYIFPNGMLPSISQIARAAEEFFVLEDCHSLGPHYDKTLMAWHRRFQSAWPRLRQRYDERFKRMWDYYLLSCAGAFRARSNQVWQVVMTRAGSGAAQPVCRF